MTALQETGTPETAATEPAPPPEAPKTYSLEEAIEEFEKEDDARRAKPDGEETETDAAPDKPSKPGKQKHDLSTPEGLKAAREEFETQRKDLDRKHIEMTNREKRAKVARERDNAEKEALKQERENFRLIRGQLEQTVGALRSGDARARLAAFGALFGKDGTQAFEEFSIAVAKNGKVPEAAPEVKELREEMARLRAELAQKDEQAEQQQNLLSSQQRFEQGKRAVAQAATADPVLGKLMTNPDAAHVVLEHLVNRAQEHFDAEGVPMSHAELVGETSNLFGALEQFPALKALALNGQLSWVIQRGRHLVQTEQLDEMAALGKLDGILRGGSPAAAPSGDLGRETQASAEPVAPADLPGRTVTPTRTASAGSTRRLTEEERIQEILTDGTYDQLFS
jgi:hypothetical protein